MKTPSKGECHGRHISVPAKVIWLLPEHLTVVSASPRSVRNRDALNVVRIVVVDDSPWVQRGAKDTRRIDNPAIATARIGAVKAVVVTVSVVAVLTESS